MNNENVNQIEKFSLLEKILMGIGFYGFIITGLCGIYIENSVLGLIYIGFLIFGFLVLFGYGLCAHCPHPYMHSDCLFPPFGQLFKKMYKFRPEQLTIIDKICFFIMMGGIVIIPQDWLFKNYILLLFFWIFCIPTLAGLLFYECRKCKNLYCPFNQTRIKT